mmetsp:Transcript_79914/g.222611  ORF Transcript_79914/g.222611 Transcript_79914/m.222611 type:complete len:352 (-) Transcript_79914:515-1570(-)
MPHLVGKVREIPAAAKLVLQVAVAVVMPRQVHACSDQERNRLVSKHLSAIVVGARLLDGVDPVHAASSHVVVIVAINVEDVCVVRDLLVRDVGVHVVKQVTARSEVPSKAGASYCSESDRLVLGSSSLFEVHRRQRCPAPALGMPSDPKAFARLPIGLPLIDGEGSNLLREFPISRLFQALCGGVVYTMCVCELCELLSEFAPCLVTAVAEGVGVCFATNPIAQTRLLQVRPIEAGEVYPLVPQLVIPALLHPLTDPWDDITVVAVGVGAAEDKHATETRPVVLVSMHPKTVPLARVDAKRLPGRDGPRSQELREQLCADGFRPIQFLLEGRHILAENRILCVQNWLIHLL